MNRAIVKPMPATAPTGTQHEDVVHCEAGGERSDAQTKHQPGREQHAQWFVNDEPDRHGDNHRQELASNARLVVAMPRWRERKSA